MTMLGIGLGGFMDGYNKMAESQREDKRAAMLDAQQARQQKQDARQDVLDARQDAEYNRQIGLRDSIAQIGKDAQAKFQEGVKAGQLDPKQFDAFWQSYAIPQIQQTYLANGEIDKAKGFMEWAKTADAERGGKLAMSAMFKAQNGDIEGGLKDAIEAGKTKGYISHDYDIQGFTPIVSAQDKKTVIGYQISARDNTGKLLESQIPLDKVPLAIANITNPPAAFESWAATQAAATKRTADLQDFKDRETIKQQLNGGQYAKLRQKAVEMAEKAYPVPEIADDAKEHPGFVQMPQERQQEIIKQYMDLLQGDEATNLAQPGRALPRTAAVPRKVLVDNRTGKVVQPVPQQAPEAAPAAASSAPVAIEKQAPVDPKKARQENIDYMIEYAAASLNQGVDPQKIAGELQAQGIDPFMWPKELFAKLDQAKSSQIGLGRQ